MLINQNGITVAELKRLVATWPEKSSSGEDNEVWIMTDVMRSSPAVSARRLNEGDIILSTED